MKKLPAARNTNIVVQNLGQEILIYDLNTHRAVGLNETSSRIYQACDGRTSFDELKNEYGLSDEILFLALEQLKANNLLAEDATYSSPFAGMKRRDVIRRAGLASMIALPVIYSVVAPTSANASSGGNFPNGTACTSNSECKTGSICKPTFLSSINPNGTSGSSIPNGTECCLGSSTTTNRFQGTYISPGNTTAGRCSFATACCSGTGTESVNPMNDYYDCTCDATS